MDQGGQLGRNRSGSQRHPPVWRNGRTVNGQRFRSGYQIQWNRFSGYRQYEFYAVGKFNRARRKHCCVEQCLGNLHPHDQQRHGAGCRIFVRSLWGREIGHQWRALRRGFRGQGWFERRNPCFGWQQYLLGGNGLKRRRSSFGAQPCFGDGRGYGAGHSLFSMG